MIVFGYKYIISPSFKKVTDINSIKKLSNQDIMFNRYNNNLIPLYLYAKRNEVKFAIKVNTLLELVIASSHGADYILVNSKLVQKAQKYANDYLIDSKILLIIDNKNQIQEAVVNSIDGVIFKKLLK